MPKLKELRLVREKPFTIQKSLQVNVPKEYRWIAGIAPGDSVYMYVTPENDLLISTQRYDA